MPRLPPLGLSLGLSLGLPLAPGPDHRDSVLQLVGRPLHHIQRQGQSGRGLRPQRGVGGLSP